MNRLVRGQILLELLVAIGVVVVTLTAMAAITTKSLSNSGFSNRQSVATGYATAGMEWIRSQKDLDWTIVYAKAGGPGIVCSDSGYTSYYCYCLSNLSGWNSSNEVACAKITGTDYTRIGRLKINSASSPQQIEAVVTVAWTEGTRTSSAKQTTVFTKY